MRDRTTDAPLCVIIPCYNEEKTIVQLLSEVLQQHEVGQVIVVNDSSSDLSGQLIMTVNDPRILYLCNEKNQGKGASVAKGISHCELPFLVIQDADLEYSPQEYKRLLAPLLDGRADAVFGSRFWHGTAGEFCIFGIMSVIHY